MNFLLHRQKTRCQVLPMPEGLEELMSDISREVLRCQPTIDCTYKFIADYLDAQIKTREKSRIAMEVIEDAILKTDEVYEYFVKCNIPREKSISFMDLMETTFRRFVEQKRRLKRDPRYITFHADDMLEELIRKCDLSKVEILRSRPAIQWAYKKFVKTYLQSIEGTLDTEDLYVNTDKLVLSCKELKDLHDAATLIQKVYRGYLTRRSIRRSMRGTLNVSMTSFELFILGRDEEIVNAAIKIQASYKGFITRKKLEAASNKMQGEQELEWLEKFTAEHAEQINHAAVKIQAYYKGFSTRKKLLLELNIAESRHPVGLIEPAAPVAPPPPPVVEEPPPPVVEEPPPPEAEEPPPPEAEEPPAPVVEEPPPPAEDPSQLELVKEEEPLPPVASADGLPPTEGPVDEPIPGIEPEGEAPPAENPPEGE